MCSKVNGERSPAEVYNDFRSSVLQILSAHKAPMPVKVPNGEIAHSNNDSYSTQQSIKDTNSRESNHQITDNDPQSTKYPRVIFIVGKYKFIYRF